MLTRAKARAQPVKPKEAVDKDKPPSVPVIRKEKYGGLGYTFRLKDVHPCSYETLIRGVNYFTMNTRDGKFQLEEKTETSLMSHVGVFYRGRTAPLATVYVFPPQSLN
mmetsp:Transcript_18102/g.20152  ORF Transcript_18102/g.20152 Transcript_18102/m.20152 type:complete len:108 (+) Transcript_18102:143-466(+)